MSKSEIFSVLKPWMTTELRLSGYDLIVFAYIHSITSKNNIPFMASAETISRTWFGDETKSRTVKDSLKALALRGFITVSTQTINGRSRNVYFTNAEDVLNRIQNGQAIPPAPTKRRNTSAGGTVPPSPSVVPYHPDSGTVPPCDSGTQVHPDGGTVPRHYIYEDVYDNYSLDKSAQINTKEEEQNFQILFFFRNARNPKEEARNFITYNLQGNWNQGKLDSHEKRLLCAQRKWKIKEGSRVDPYLLEFIHNLYVWGTKKGIADTELLLDPTIKGRRIDDNTYYLKCPENVHLWLESHVDQLRSAVAKCLKVKSLMYE